MHFNLPVTILVIIVLLILVILLVYKNQKDKKDLEQKLNEDYEKQKHHEDDVDTTILTNNEFPVWLHV
jgi:FtsZ-interacting cell division protein ZipA